MTENKDSSGENFAEWYKNTYGPEAQGRQKNNIPNETKNWLTDERELKKITNNNLKTFIKFTGSTQPDHLKASSVLNSIDKLQDLVLNKKISQTDADKLIPKLHEQLRNLVERDKQQKLASEEKFIDSMTEAQRKAKTEQISLDLPKVEQNVPITEKEKQIEDQRAYIRYFLDNIENSNRDSHDFAISYITNALESSLKNMEPSVREEVEVRLSLHDCSELIRQANGWIARDANKVGPGYTIGSAAAEALRRGHDLTRRKIKVLLEPYNSKTREGIPNLKIAEAWNLLQEANTHAGYQGFILEINKSLLLRKGYPAQKIERFTSWCKNFKGKFVYDKLNDEDRSKLNEIGIEEKDFRDLHEISGLEFRDDEAMQGEVFSNFYTDSDSVRKEAIRKYLIEQLGGGEIGQKNLQLAEKLTIASLETSIFNKSFTGNDELAEIINLKDWRKGRAATGRARGPKIHEDAIPGFGKSWLRGITGKNIDSGLTAEEILNNINKIKEGNYSYFCSVIVTRYYLLKELLLDRATKPKSIDKNSLQTAVVYFNTADEPKEGEKCGPLALRAWWLAGVVDIALAKEDLEWDAYSFKELKKAAIMEELSPKVGTFITPEQWGWIEKETNFTKRVGSLFKYRTTRAALASLKFH